MEARLYREDGNAFMKAFWSAFLLSALFYTSPVYAVAPNLQTMLTNFATAVPNLMRLVTASAYVMGMFFIIASVMGMKHLGESRTMQSKDHGVMGPMIELLVGAALLYLPSSVQSGLSTFWLDPSPLSYPTDTSDQYALFIGTCFSIIELIGTIAFIRGLMMLKDAAGERAQQGMIGKALAHMVGGILCINMYGTLQVLEATVGWTQ